MSNAPADAVPVPVTNAGQVVTTRRDVWQRFGRTAIQLVAGGILTGVVNQLALDLPAAYVPYLMAASTAVVTVAQNVAEEQGWVPTVLKKPVATA